MNPPKKNAPDAVGAAKPGHVHLSSSTERKDMEDLRCCTGLCKYKRAIPRRADGRRLSYAERFVHRQMPLRPIETARLFADLADLKAED